MTIDQDMETQLFHTIRIIPTSMLLNMRILRLQSKQKTFPLTYLIAVTKNVKTLINSHVNSFQRTHFNLTFGGHILPLQKSTL